MPAKKNHIIHAGTKANKKPFSIHWPLLIVLVLIVQKLTSNHLFNEFYELLKRIEAVNNSVWFPTVLTYFML